MQLKITKRRGKKPSLISFSSVRNSNPAGSCHLVAGRRRAANGRSVGNAPDAHTRTSRAIAPAFAPGAAGRSGLHRRWGGFGGLSGARIWRGGRGRHNFGKIEQCHFSNTLKLEIFSKLRMAFEKRSLRAPVNRAIREDLHSVNRVSSPTGQITYRAPHRNVGQTAG
jgi:hypothetical protein